MKLLAGFVNPNQRRFNKPAISCLWYLLDAVGLSLLLVLGDPNSVASMSFGGVNRLFEPEIVHNGLWHDWMNISLVVDENIMNSATIRVCLWPCYILYMFIHKLSSSLILVNRLTVDTIITTM